MAKSPDDLVSDLWRAKLTDSHHFERLKRWVHAGFWAAIAFWVLMGGIPLLLGSDLVTLNPETAATLVVISGVLGVPFGIATLVSRFYLKGRVERDRFHGFEFFDSQNNPEVNRYIHAVQAGGRGWLTPFEVKKLYTINRIQMTTLKDCSDSETP